MLTAPNGSAQQLLYRDSLRSASTQEQMLKICALHGTGTALGDPVEAGSLSAVFLKSAREVCTISGIKANTGHTGAAGGLVALLILSMNLMQRKVHPHAQLRQMSAHVCSTLRGTLSGVPVSVAPIDAKLRESIVGGVSSFGWSGTLAHGVLAGERGNAKVPLTLAFRRKVFAFGPAVSRLVTLHAGQNQHGQQVTNHVGSALHTSGVESVDGVVRLVNELTAGEDRQIDADTPLMEAGVESLVATEFASRLQSMTSLKPSSTIVFEQPTPRAIAAWILEHRRSPGAAEVSVASIEKYACTALDGVTLRLAGKLSSRWPGDCDGGLTLFQMGAACGNAVGEVPSARWTMPEVCDETVLASIQATCVRHGGFVARVQLFDVASFSLSPAEAKAMDPQQRLLLEHGYAASHSASYRRSTLLDANNAVLVAVERPDWSNVQPPLARQSIYAVTGDNVSVASGRLSFVLGLQGPCSSIDTACSSSLSALHWGCYTVKHGESDGALVLAASLKLQPHGTLGASSAGMLSVDGRCKTLDAGAMGTCAQRVSARSC